MQVTIALYPQLRLLCWNRPGDVVLDGATALALYEANWRHVNEAALTPEEWRLIDELVAQHGAGVLLAERSPDPVFVAGATPASDHCHRPGERPHHWRIATALRALDADLLGRAKCFLGGGTAVVLSLGEYRACDGVRLLCASQEGYRLLYERAHGTGLDALLRVPGSLRVRREVRADPHGLRAVLEVEGHPVRVEIVREDRMRLEGAPHPGLGVPVLVQTALFCERLLSNADRHADRAAMGRDVVDLAMMVAAWGSIPRDAWEGARRAYGDLVDEAYARAMAGLRDPNRLEECMQALAVSPDLKATLLAALDGLTQATR